MSPTFLDPKSHGRRQGEGSASLRRSPYTALESPPVVMHTLEHTRDAAKRAEVTPLSKEKQHARFLSYQIRLLDITPEQLETVVATLDALGVCHHIKKPYAEKTQLEMEDQVDDEKKRFKRMREEDEQGEWIEILRPFG